MEARRTWERIGESRWFCDPWSITGYVVSDGMSYALWRGEEQKATAYHRDRAELMRMAREIEAREATA